MAGQPHPASRFVLEAGGNPLGRFEALHAATSPGAPPRALQPQELVLLTSPSGGPVPAKDGDGGYVLTAVSHSARARPAIVTASMVPRGGSGAPKGAGGLRTLTLRRGRGDGLALHRWSGTATPRDAVLVALDAGGRAFARYKLTQAWPVKWHVPPAAKGGGEVAIEEMTLAYRSLQRL